MSNPPLNVLICDDEPLARDRLRRMLSKIEGVNVVAEACHGLDLIERLPDAQPDLVITDIRMPGMSGLEAAAHICAQSAPPALIFCTAYDEYAVRAFNVNAIGYLLKPVRQVELELAIGQAQRVNKAQLQAVQQDFERQGQAHQGHAQDAPPDQQGAARQHISAKSHRGIELIPVSDIRFFRADQKYVSVHYSTGSVLIDESLRELEQEFAQLFLRVHRNALVALVHVEALESSQNQYQLRFRGIAEKAQVSRRHLKEVKTLLQRL